MCIVDLDQWNCRRCLQPMKTTERISSWKTCEIGPTYGRACPAFTPIINCHHNSECEPCKQATAAAAAAEAAKAAAKAAKAAAKAAKAAAKVAKAAAEAAAAEKQTTEREEGGSNGNNHTLGRSPPIDPQLAEESKGDDHSRNTTMSKESGGQEKEHILDG